MLQHERLRCLKLFERVRIKIKLWAEHESDSISRDLRVPCSEIYQNTIPRLTVKKDLKYILE